MANRGFYPAYSYGNSRLYLEFSFLANNVTAPLLTSVEGVGANVIASFSRGTPGVIVITFNDAFGKVITANADMDDTANDGAYATVGTVTNEGTATPLQLTVRTRAATGTLTDFTARKVSVNLTLRNGNWGVK